MDDDSEVLPKRRKLDPPEEEPNGQKVKDAISLEKESKEKTTPSWNMPNHHKKLKWNFKLIRPEALKYYRSMVDGLSHAGPEGKRSDENESVPLQQNDLTSREEKKESASAPKRKFDPDGVKNPVYQESTSAACVLPTNCSTFLTISHERLEPSKEIKNGCTINNHAPTQQHPLEGLILDPPITEKLQHEIRKIIKDHTREVMDRAESLKSRISTLESENRWLKHKVTLLYGALTEQLTRRKLKQNKVPTATLTSSTLQEKTLVKSNESDSLPEALLQPLPCSQTVIGNKTKDGSSHSLQSSIATDTNYSLRFDSEKGDKTHQRDKAPPAAGSEPKIQPPHNLIHSMKHSIISDQTTKLVSTAPNGPIASIGQDPTLSSIYSPKHTQTVSKNPVQTTFVPPTKPTLHNPVLSSVVTLDHKGINIPSNGKTSNSAPNPVALLCQVLEEILASSAKDVQNQYTLSPLCRLEDPLPKNVLKPLTHTATGIMTSRATPTGNEEVLRKQHSSNENSGISMKLSSTQTEKTCQGDIKTLLAKHRAAEYLSPISLDQEVSKEGSKHSKLLGSTCIVENERKKEVSLLANNGTCHYRTHADTQLTDCQPQSNVAVVASPVSSNSQLTTSIPENPTVSDSSGQSVGVLDGINMLAQAAGLGDKTTDPGPIICPEKSSKTSPLGTTLGESNKIHTCDLSQQGLNDHALEECCFRRMSQPSQKSFIPQPEQPQRHKCVVGQHVFSKGPLKGQYTNVITRYVDEQQKSLKVENQKLNKTELLNPPEHANSLSLHQEERTTHSRHNNSVFVNGDQELTSISHTKFKAMLYHADQEEGDNSLSPSRFYNSLEYQEHTTRKAQKTGLVRNHVISNPRHLPYPPIRPKEQQALFAPPIRSKIQYVPKVNEKQSPKPDELPRLTSPLNGDVSRRPHVQETSAKNGNTEFSYQLPKFSSPPETSSSEIRLNAPSSSSTTTSPKYNKERLLLQLLHSDRAPYISRHFPTHTLQTVNTANFPSKSSETCKRYVYLQPKRHVQNGIQNPEEPPLCSRDKTKRESKALPCKQVLTVEEGSFKGASLHLTSKPNPQVELSHSCQRYITRLRSSTRQLSHDISTNVTAKPPPYTEIESLDLKNYSHHGLKFSSPCSSVKRQDTQDRYDAHEMHLKTSLSEPQKHNNDLPQYQRPRLVLNHQNRISSKRQQEHVSEKRLKSCSGTPKPASSNLHGCER